MESEGLKKLVAKIDEIAREVEGQEEMPEYCPGYHSTLEKGVRFLLYPKHDQDFFWFEKRGYNPLLGKGKFERERHTYFIGFEPKTLQEVEYLDNHRQKMLERMKYEEFEKEFFNTIMKEPINPKRSIGGVTIAMQKMDWTPAESEIKCSTVGGPSMFTSYNEMYYWHELAFRTGITRCPFTGDIEIPGRLLESMK